MEKRNDKDKDFWHASTWALHFSRIQVKNEEEIVFQIFYFFDEYPIPCLEIEGSMITCRVSKIWFTCAKIRPMYASCNKDIVMVIYLQIIEQLLQSSCHLMTSVSITKTKYLQCWSMFTVSGWAQPHNFGLAHTEHNWTAWDFRNSITASADY